MKQLITFGIILLFTACSTLKSGNGSIYWVNSYEVDCVGVGPMKCLQVQKGKQLNKNEWQNFYTQIEGFEYEPGYVYKLRIKEEKLKNVPADASSIKYILEEVIEKKEDPRWNLNGNWDALKINGSIIKLPRIRGAGTIPQLNIDMLEGRISGTDGCNNFTGTLQQITDNEINMGPLAQTRKMCPDMTIATAFMEALNKATHYTVFDTKLVLKDAAGNELLEFTKGTEAKVLLNDIWVAEWMEGQYLDNETDLPRLEINSTKMEAAGTDGCNNLHGRISELTNTKLTFGVMAGTRMMCADMNIPDKFNQLLPKVRSYKISELKLSLFDEQGEVLMILRKVD
ncbi:META domain-containing protein [Maribellus sp. CM-23]|uniref:META domain-containing protein n=1 Tax=Maribellus sp. CM-23 TaxID=2781026 RepID=UPI001F1CB29F|nr:META domain-containing protein [Maribellus sp. CM-23]MCE4564288.1 META domain-containing protein [Maribellus sp. CM-23]